MGLNAEFQRNIDAAIAAGKTAEAAVFEAHKHALEELEAAEVINQLPVPVQESQQTTQAPIEEASTAAAVEVPLIVPSPTKLTRVTFRDQLYEGLKARGQEVDLPEPSAAIVEVHGMLVDRGFDVAPIVYVDRGKQKATYAVIEQTVRPEYNQGLQMFYATKNGTSDPLANILKRGREEDKRIAIINWTEHVPHNSRFGVSWDETHGYVVEKLVEETPYLAEHVAKSGIMFRVPTKAEFQSAGEKYPHFGQANTWEWLYDGARFGYRLFGGHRGSGGVNAVVDWPSGHRGGSIAFRLQAVSQPQKLPRLGGRSGGVKRA